MSAPRLPVAVIATIDPDRARDLTDRIKVAADGTWLLIKEAYLSRAWAALGYTSWDDYCTREFGTCRLRLPREERQEFVASLREIGLSVRAIASATGGSTRTVQKDLREVWSGTTPDAGEHHDLDDVLAEAGIDPDALDADGGTDEVSPEAFGPAEPQGSPQRITGTDGKTYTTSAPRPATTPQRSALPPQFQSASAELSRVIHRLERLREDDRYRANRGAITTQCLPEIRRAAQVLRDLLAELGHENGGPQ